jgi:hypothetical protein
VYHLDVIQQPQRARACGFGDKVSRARLAPVAPRNHMLTLYLGSETSIAAPHHSPMGDDAYGRASGHQVSLPSQHRSHPLTHSSQPQMANSSAASSCTLPLRSLVLPLHLRPPLIRMTRTFHTVLRRVRDLARPNQSQQHSHPHILPFLVRIGVWATVLRRIT